MNADDIIAALGLERHPEGGWYRQTWVADNGPRPSGTCIYFLLKADERSHWHRVDADEIWLYHAGAALTLKVAETAAGPVKALTLGPDIASGDRPQQIIPAGHWQAAESMGEWTLVSCTVSPGFQFEGFELAPPDFDIKE